DAASQRLPSHAHADSRSANQVDPRRHDHDEGSGDRSNLGHAPGRSRLSRQARLGSRARRQSTGSAGAGVERLTLQALAEQPFALLVELERRARAAIAARDGAPAASDEWVGIGLRPGAEGFVRSRGDVREVLPIPEQVTRVPGAKPWLRGIANLRGQLLTVVDLKSFLGAGAPAADRQARGLVVP